MAKVNMTAQLLQRRDTAANWTSSNPVLPAGQIAYETDTEKFKIGNGITAWNNLGYFVQGPTIFVAKLDPGTAPNVNYTKLVSLDSGNALPSSNMFQVSPWKRPFYIIVKAGMATDDSITDNIRIDKVDGTSISGGPYPVSGPNSTTTSWAVDDTLILEYEPTGKKFILIHTIPAASASVDTFISDAEIEEIVGLTLPYANGESF